jgi:hypothetical protein
VISEATGGGTWTMEAIAGFSGVMRANEVAFR